MAVVPMHKMQIVAHKDCKKQILDFLQDKGIFHVVDSDNMALESEFEQIDQELHSTEYEIAEIEHAIKLLKPYDPSPRIGLEAMIEGDSVTLDTNTVQSVLTKFDPKQTIKELNDIEARKVEISNQLRELSELKAILEPWKDLPFALNEARKTRFTEMVLGTIDVREWDVFQQEIIKITPYVHVKKISNNHLECYAYVISLLSEAQKIKNFFSDYSFHEVSLLESNLTPAAEISALLEKENTLMLESTSLESKLIELGKNLSNLKIIHDTLSWKKDNINVQKKFHFTKETVMLRGWVPSQQVETITSYLDSEVKLSAYFVSEVEASDEPPVKIENSNFIEPFETITRISGLPKYRELDPSKYLAPFFALFFAFCLTDAGYGLMLIILSVGLIKLLRIPRTEQGLLRLLAYSGLMTILLGIPFGGWFGLDPSKMPEWMTYQAAANGTTQTFFVGQILNPNKSAVNLLIFAFILGYIHIVFGKILEGYNFLRHGQIKDALLGSFVFAYTLIALAFFAATSNIASIGHLVEPSKYALLTGVVLMVLTQARKSSNVVMKLLGGTLSLYGIIGYISDMLSYARLLALGLATGIIGSSINLVAALLGDMIPVIGIVVSILIFVLGHIFNLILNTLGAFIHSGRLQFIEFFGKFIEGGGAAFNPLRKKTKYLKIQS